MERTFPKDSKSTWHNQDSNPDLLIPKPQSKYVPNSALLNIPLGMELNQRFYKYVNTTQLSIFACTVPHSAILSYLQKSETFFLLPFDIKKKNFLTNVL